MSVARKKRRGANPQDFDRPSFNILLCCAANKRKQRCQDFDSSFKLTLITSFKLVLYLCFNIALRSKILEI